MYQPRERVEDQRRRGRTINVLGQTVGYRQPSDAPADHNIVVGLVSSPSDGGVANGDTLYRNKKIGHHELQLAVEPHYGV